AEAIAQREFGDVAGARAELASIDRRRGTGERRAAWWADLRLDVRFALRQLWRDPLFTAIAAATIGLGIGANTAIFSVVERVLINPLPFREADRLVQVWESRPGRLDARSEASYLDYQDWLAQSKSFAGLAGVDPTNVAVSGPGGAEMLSGARVTPEFFQLLGVTPLIGRAFVPAEDVPGGAGVVVLSHGFWQRRFAGDPRILDSTIVVDRRALRIVGVLPPSFRFAPLEPADLWLPLDASSRRREARFNHWVNVVGRLRPGVSAEQADADLDRVMAGLESAYPETNRGRRADVVPLKRQFLGEIRPVVLALFGAVGLLLLIACANVANLLIAKSLTRTTEMRIRSALGAHRGRLVRQLLAESVALAVLGGIVGLGVAVGGLGLLVTSVPADLQARIPALGETRLDGTVLGYSAAITLLTGILVGLLPAGRIAGRRGQTSLAGTSRATTSRSGAGTRDLIAAGELALTTALLIGVGLVGRSLWTLLVADVGFEADRVLTARVALAGPAYESARAQRQFVEQVLEQAAGIGGVTAVGGVSKLPLSGGGTNSFRVEGQPEPDPAARPGATMRAIAGGYFQALGIPLVNGRFFSTQDDSAKAPTLLINVSLGQQLFGGANPVGRSLRFYAFPERAWAIIEVVGDVRTGRLETTAPPTIYYSHLQSAENRMTFVLKTVGVPGAAAPALRARIASLDSSVPVYDVQTMEQQIAGATALVLAAIGLYGVVAAGVAERTREFGIRLALGAARSQVLSSVVKRGAAIAATGVAAGLLIGAGAARALGGLLYGVTAADPLTHVLVAATMMIVGIAASYVPARRATGVPPITAMRGE
ncbi:MAG: ABC transporter permease, partial [Gemmatimonadota bacterium]